MIIIQYTTVKINTNLIMIQYKTVDIQNQKLATKIKMLTLILSLSLLILVYKE